MPPVDPGPFQTIVDVGWPSMPSLLLIRFVLPAPRVNDANLEGSFDSINFSCQVESDLPGGLIRYGFGDAGGYLWSFGGLPFGRQTTKFDMNFGLYLGLDYGLAIAIDLQAVRQAFIQAAEGLSAGPADPVPDQLRIVVSGAFNFSDAGAANEPVEITALLYRGSRAEYVEVQRNGRVTDFSALNVAREFLERPITSSVPQNLTPGEEAGQFGLGVPLETLIVGLKEMTLNWEADLS